MRVTPIIIAAALGATACTSTSAELVAAPTTVEQPQITDIAESSSRQDEIDALTADFVAGADGGAILLTSRGGETFSSAAGSLNARGESLAVDTPMRVGSVSKPFVATMVLQLVAEGAVDLDAPLIGYLPETPLGADVTVRQLLSHRSGLPDYTAQPVFPSLLLDGPGTVYSPDDMLTLVADVATEESGGNYEYSNTNYILLGQLVEAIDSVDINAALAARITEPLGLSHTKFVFNEGENLAGLASFWSPGFNDGDTDFQYQAISSSAWAAGSLVSTVGDLNLFMAALLNGDLIPDDLQAQMMDTGDSDYGLGLASAPLGIGRTGYGHAGYIPGYQSVMFVEPETLDAYIAITNDDSLIANDLLVRVLTTE